MTRLKIIMTWDIRPGREQEYSEFINEKFAPGLVEIGIPPSDVFYTAYGAVPQILAVLEAADRQALLRALRSQRWADLKRHLLQLIEHYGEKVIDSDQGNYF
ncbi:MAG: hypothetical protein HUU23_11275 [Caldilineales bacterium]|nr:hypothetical protein [Caldilineales bacterium]